MTEFLGVPVIYCGASTDAQRRSVAETSLKFGLMTLDVAVSLSPYG